MPYSYLFFFAKIRIYFIVNIYVITFNITKRNIYYFINYL
nr:MAG TPA: hypothetical protein [Caudoviricetes sp.]